MRESPLPVLLEYARAANVYVDALIDDLLDLPERLPSQMKHDGLTKLTLSKRRRYNNEFR